MSITVLRRPAVLLAAALLAVPALAQSSLAHPHPSPLVLPHPVADKNFYLFSALERSSAAQHALANAPDLTRIAAARRNMLALAARTCKQDIGCEALALAWTNEEILAISLVLRGLGDSDPSLRALVDNDLRPSYTYVPLDNLGPGDTIARAWEICAHGVNNILAVYGQARPATPPSIPSPSTHSPTKPNSASPRSSPSKLHRSPPPSPSTPHHFA